MDNQTMARLLAETADLLEIDGADSFRIRSYRRVAEAAEQTTVNLVEAATDTARLLEIDGIGKGMAAKLQAIAATGTLEQREELLAKYGEGVLELLKLPGMGPKTVALLWDAAKIGSIDQLSQAIEAGRLEGLPRMGAKQIEKLRKGIDDYRRNAAVAALTWPRKKPRRIAAYLLEFKGIEKVTPAGSLRRGRETVGDLDLLATGPACEPEKLRPRCRIRRRLSRNPRHDRQRRKQGELPCRPGLAGRRPSAAHRFLWRGAAVLHRLKGA